MPVGAWGYFCLTTPGLSQDRHSNHAYSPPPCANEWMDWPTKISLRDERLGYLIWGAPNPPDWSRPPGDSPDANVSLPHDQEETTNKDQEPEFSQEESDVNNSEAPTDSPPFAFNIAVKETIRVHTSRAEEAMKMTIAQSDNSEKMSLLPATLQLQEQCLQA